MALYKLTNRSLIIKTDTQMYIPIDVNNGDYKNYLAWVALGNVADAADSDPLTYQTDDNVIRRAQTTSASIVEIFRGTLATNTGYIARLRLLGVDTGNGNIKYIAADFVMKRLGAGAILIGSNVNPVIQDAGASTWAVAANVSGNDFVITVAGAAGRTVEWSLNGSYISFTPSGR